MQTLLAQAPWLRRLAAALVGDAHQAEDLTQDTLVAAIAAPPNAAGVAAARAWLRRVAQRTLWKARTRERQRDEVERAAAKPESTRVDVQLEYGRWLADAVDALPEPYRSAVTLRYFEELPPRQLARRLGITAQAARQRVARGVAMLRQRLDRKAGGRGPWTAALLALAPPARPAGAATAAVTATLVTLMPYKLTVAALGLGAAATALLVTWWPGPATGVEPRPNAERPAAAVSATPRATPPSSANADAVPSPRTLVPPNPSADAVQLRVVTPDGAPARGAQAVWVGRDGRVRELALTADATALLPAASGGCRFYAVAPGFAGAQGIAAAEPTPLALQLGRAATLRGRVLEHGGRPAIGLRLRITAAPPDGIAAAQVSDPTIERALEEWGWRANPTVVDTDDDGRFAIADLPVDWHGHLTVANTHVLFRVDGVPLQGLEADTLRAKAKVMAGHEHLIETLQRPTVRGTVIHASTGEPVASRFVARLRDRSAGGDMLWFEETDAEGRFTFGLPVPFAELVAAAHPHQVQSRFDAVSLDFRDVASSPARFDLRDRTPPFDLGVLRIGGDERVVIVHGADGAPLSGAVLVSEHATATTDGDGSVRLAIGAPTTIDIIAVAHAWHRALVPPGPEPFAVQLRAGPTLRFAGLAPEQRVRVDWATPPFAATEAEPPPHRAHVAFASQRDVIAELRRSSGGRDGSLTITADPTGIVLLPGLRPGAVLEVGAADWLGAAVSTHTIAVPGQPGIHDVQLATAAAPASQLTIECVDHLAEPVPRATVMITNGTRGRSARTDDQGCVTFPPLTAGRYSVYVQAEGFVHERHEPTLPAIDVLRCELEPSRSLRVRIRDVLGTTLAAASVEAQSDDGHRATASAATHDATLHGLPQRPVTATITVGSRTYEQHAGARAQEVVFTLPVHGALRVTADGDDLAGTLSARIVDARGETTEVAASTEGTVQTPLLPDTYRVFIESVRGGSMGTPRQVQRLGEHVVTIEPGKTQALEASSPPK